MTSEPEHVQFIVPDKGSMDMAGLVFMRAVHLITWAKAVELAIVAYHFSEQEKDVQGDLTIYPSVNEMYNFMDQYVDWRDRCAQGSTEPTGSAPEPSAEDRSGTEGDVADAES